MGIDSKFVYCHYIIKTDAACDTLISKRTVDKTIAQYDFSCLKFWYYTFDKMLPAGCCKKQSFCPAIHIVLFCQQYFANFFTDWYTPWFTCFHDFMRI